MGDFLEAVASGSELHAADLLPLEMQHQLATHFQIHCLAALYRFMAASLPPDRSSVILR
ncbi:hypothetical protein [Paraburkholderia aromaticivorans]|uniref:hypothetical protein n=1 Tax=Paraburkholderia aromaticivorans TaxID=2026199 RepID=UPI0012FDCDE3|nr:hypothetical protein [Paraburkholderia aromaticivorans]